MKCSKCGNIQAQKKAKTSSNQEGKSKSKVYCVCTLVIGVLALCVDIISFVCSQTLVAAAKYSFVYSTNSNWYEAAQSMWYLIVVDFFIALVAIILGIIGLVKHKGKKQYFILAISFGALSILSFIYFIMFIVA